MDGERPSAAGAGLLSGLRVIDLSQWLPGPAAGQLLSDLGAEVLKVEPPAGDPMRGLGPIDGDGVSAWYKAVNAGKRVLRLDLSARHSRRGREDGAHGAGHELDGPRRVILTEERRRPRRPPKQHQTISARNRTNARSIDLLDLTERLSQGPWRPCLDNRHAHNA